MRNVEGKKFEEEFKVLDFEEDFKRCLYFTLDSHFHKSCNEIELIIRLNITEPVYSIEKSFSMENSYLNSMTCIFRPLPD